MKKLVLVLTAALAAHASSNAQTNGVWTNPAGGNWLTTTNWSGGNVAGGTNASADFNTLNVTADASVTLSAPVTIGSMIFGDTDTNSAAGWTLGSGALTLAGTNPTVTVTNLGTGKSVTFDAQVLGTNGLVKNGLGSLVLNNASNSYTGAITTSFTSIAAFGSPLFSTLVERGRLVLGSGTAAGTGNILVRSNNSVGGTALLDLNGNTVSNNIGLAGDSYLYNGSTSNAATLNGDLWVTNFTRIGSATGDGAGTVIVNGKVVFSGAGVQLFTGVGGALTVLNGTVTHSNSNGTIILQSGTLRAHDGVNIATNSTLLLGWTNTTGQFGGILESSNNVTRAIGALPGEIGVGHRGTTNTNIGFSAFGAPITVALGGTSSPTALTWGQTNFLQGSSTLVLNAATADNTLTFANKLNLGGSNRTISVNAATAIVNGGLTNGSLTKAGAGTLILGGTNSFTADTTINGGTLRTTLSSLAGNVAVTNNSTFVLDEAANSDFTGTISGAGFFEKAGSGTLTLSGTNSYTRNTTVSSGTLRLANSNSLGVTTNTVTVASGATLDLNGATNAGRFVTIAGSGVGGLGAVVNNGALQAGGLRVVLAAGASLGGTARMDLLGGGTLVNGGTNTLTKTGTNVLAINPGTVIIGQINVDQGILSVINNSGGLGDTNYGSFVASGANLTFFNNSLAIGSTNSENITLAGGATLSSTTSTNPNTLNGTITLSSGTATVSVGTNGVGMVLGGVVTGAGGLNKTTGGTLELRGTNTYSGNTTITDGAVTLAQNARLSFVIGGNGTNNAVGGTGTFNNDGVFVFNLSGASTTPGDSWTIIAPTVTRTYGTNFLVSGFSGAGGNWTNTTNGATYVFTQSNNVLTVQSGTTNNYASWVSYWQGVNPGFTNTAGTDNPDGDPFDNNEEFAFDGNPAIGSPALLTATKAGTNVVFQWVQRKNPPGGASYAVQKTPILTVGWTNASVTIWNATNQSGLNIPSDYERKEFVVPAAAQDFYRVQATVAP